MACLRKPLTLPSALALGVLSAGPIFADAFGVDLAGPTTTLPDSVAHGVCVSDPVVGIEYRWIPREGRS